MVNDKPLNLTSPTQRQGSRFEQQACAFLQAQGLILIAQNWQQPKVGELDLIMLEKGQAWSTLVFIEVRQRQRSGFGDAALSVTKSKQHKAARYFLQQHPEYNDFEYRFDVIAYDTNVNTSASHKNKSSEVKETTSKNTQPEWLQGAFIASAW